MHWSLQAGLRATFFFIVTGYVYIFKPGGIAGASNFSGLEDEGLKNSVVFTWSFLEVMVWVWVSFFLEERWPKCKRRGRRVLTFVGRYMRR